MMERNMEGFSTFDIRDKMGIKPDRVKDWLKNAYIKPSIQKAAGTGTKNIFSRTDLYLIRLFEYLLSRGISRITAAVRLGAFIHFPQNQDKITRFDFVAFYYIDDKDAEARQAHTSMVFFQAKDVGKIKTKDFGEMDDILIFNLKKIREHVDACLDG